MYDFVIFLVISFVTSVSSQGITHYFDGYLEGNKYIQKGYVYSYSLVGHSEGNEAFEIDDCEKQMWATAEYNALDNIYKYMTTTDLFREV